MNLARARRCGVGQSIHQSQNKKMGVQRVRVERQLPIAPDLIWAQVRDFCALWHPAVDTMKKHIDDTGHIIRRFTVQAENTVYQERLIWFSDSERTMKYTHVDGIVGVNSYVATLSVSENGMYKCSVSMSAEIAASEPRLSEIASGTRAIFESGLAALRDFPTPQEYKVDAHSSDSVRIDHLMIKRDHRIATSFTKGPPLSTQTICLFLHGIGGNRHNWNAQLRVLAPICTAVAMDLRGYGDSHLGPSQSTVEDYCADILKVLDEFDAQNVILCGLSYGAWIATSFAMRHPSKLAALVLSGGCTGMSEASKAEQNVFRESRELPLSRGETPADFAPKVVSLIAGPNCATDVKKELLSSMKSIQPATYRDALHCFTTPTEVFDFAKITVPTLVMTGEHDALAPPQELKAISNRILDMSPIPDVRFEKIGGAGHVCNLEQPEAFNAPLQALVRRVVK